MPNEFHSDIPASVLTLVQKALDDIQATLAPYLLSLTPKERKSMLRMGDKTVAFVTKVTERATNAPSFVPDFVSLSELKQATAAMAALNPIRQRFAQLALDTDSTMMMAGSVAYGASLTVYGNVKFLAKNKRPGAQAAYQDLSSRFPSNTGSNRKDPVAKS